MSEHHTPLDQLTPSERAKVNAHLRGYLASCTGAEVPGRPVEAHLACRELERQAEALVLSAVELAAAYRRADRLVDEIVRECDDDALRSAGAILGWTRAQGTFALVVGLLAEAGGTPTEVHLDMLKDDRFDLLLGGDR